VQFSDGESPWREMPEWVHFLMNLGYRWPGVDLSARRIGFVSMPCDSAAAGFIALGAMRRRLEKPEAHDLGIHYERILALGKPDPDNPILIHKVERGEWEFAELIRYGGVRVKRADAAKKKNQKAVFSYGKSIIPDQAGDWYFLGEPQVTGSEPHYLNHYASLLEDAGNIHIQNLTRSDRMRGVCLVGRVAGECATLNLMNDVCFKAGGENRNLAELLTIDGWSSFGSSSGPVPRVSFVNSRFSDSITNHIRPSLVVVDGDQALLRVLVRSEFDECDIVCAYSRTVERERLEDLGAKLEHLSQWYSVDRDSLLAYPRSPRGIAISMLKKRISSWS